MLSITNAYSAEYLTRQVAPGLENYYTASIGDGIRGEPPGIWTGRGCAKLGLSGEVDNAVFERMVDGFWDPRDAAFLDSSVPDKEKARLGNPPRYFKTPEELYAHKLAEKPDASPEERAELWAHAQKYARQGSVKGRDMTFSPAKSVTILHMSCEAKAQAALQRGDLDEAQLWTRRAELVWEAVMAGNQAILDDIQGNAGQSRAGYFGKKAGQRVTGRYVDVDEFVVASFRQHTNRNEDGNLHVHNFILWRCDQGDEEIGERWRTPDSYAINKRRAAAAAIGERTMFERLAATLGVDLRKRADGHGLEVDGIEQTLIDAHSSRRVEVTDAMRELVAGYEARHGRTPSAKALFQMAQFATLDTKARKLKLPEQPTRAELLAAWEDHTRATCEMSLTEVPDHTMGRLSPAALAGRAYDGYDTDQVLDMALAEVQAKRNSWGRAQLIQAINEHLPETLGGLDAQHVAGLLNELADEALSAQRGGVVLANAPEVVTMPQTLLRADGTSIYQPRHAERYTAEEHVDREGGLLAAARATGAVRLSAVRAARVLGLPMPEPTVVLEEPEAEAAEPGAPGGQPEVGVEPVEPTVAEAEPGTGEPAPAAQGADRSPAPTGDSAEGASGAETGVNHSTPARPAFGLRPDQAAAVYGILTDGLDISVLNAPAGAGKSFTVSVVDKVWRENTGGRVVGLTTSQNASFVLHGEGFEEAHNIARFLDDVRAGEQELDAGDLLVVDEASMVSTADLHRLRELAKRAGAKLLLTGDPEQLGAVGAGGMMRLISQDVGAYELTEIARFDESWEADASRRLRDGDASVLPTYEAAGRLRDGSAEEMETKAYTAWLADHLSGRESLLIAPDNQAAVALSGRARARLVELGLVEPDGVELRDGNAAGVGDLITTRRNDRRISDAAGRWVANRDTYRVLNRREAGALEVERVSGSSHERGRRLVLPGSYVATATELAYAGTVHAAQGRTVDTAHAIITGQVDRALLYVALTRARLRNMAYVVTDPVGRADVRPDARPAPQADPGQVDLGGRSPEEIRARRAVVLGAYEELRGRRDPRYGDRGRLEEVAGELVDQLAEHVPDLDPETARAWLDAHLGGRTALGVLAEVMDVTEAADDPTATEVIREEQDRVSHQAHLGPQWIDITRSQRGELVEGILRQMLTPEELEKWQEDEDTTVPLVKVLREAETSGLDFAGTLRNAISQRELLDDPNQAESIGALLYWRVEKKVQARHKYLAENPKVAERLREHTPATWVERTPTDLPDAEKARVALEFAQAMDARNEALADWVAAEPPTWALDHLGPLPEDPLDAEEWKHKVGLVAGYVEQFVDETEAGVDRDPVGLDPGPANPEAHAAWAQAARALGLSVAQREIREASLGELGRRRAAYARLLDWSPAHVADQLREAHIAMQDFESSAALLAAQARAAATDAERTGLAARAARDARLAEAAGERVAQLTEIHTTRDQWIIETEQARQAAEAAGEEIRRRRTANPSLWRRTGADLPGLHETPEQRAERERVAAQREAKAQHEPRQVDEQMQLPLDGAGQPTVAQQQRLDLRARTEQMRETLRRRLHGWLRADRTDEVTAAQVAQATEDARQQIPGPHHGDQAAAGERDQEARAEQHRRAVHRDQGSLFEVADEQVQPDLREATAQADQARRLLVQREQQRQAQREQRDREAAHTARRMRERHAEPEQATARPARRERDEVHLPGPSQSALDAARSAGQQAEAEHKRHQPPTPKPPEPPQRGGGGRSV